MAPLTGEGQIQATPLVVDGIMYTTGPVGLANAASTKVYALDAKTGRQFVALRAVPKRFRNQYENQSLEPGRGHPRQPCFSSARSMPR